MHHGHYLQLHRRRYRFRMRIPRGLVHFDYRGDLLVSLQTDSFSLAVKRARFLRVSVESLMIDLSQCMDRADADQIVRRWVDKSTRQWEANMALSGGFAFFDEAEVGTMGTEQAGEMEDLMRLLGDTVARPTIKAAASAALSGRRPQALAAIEPIVASAMSEFAPEIDRSSVDGRLLARTFIHGLVSIIDEQSAMERGEPRQLALPPLILASSGAAAPARSLPDFILMTHWDAFEKSKIKDGKWTLGTGSNARSTRNLFTGLFENTSASEVTRATAAELRTLLFSMPSKYDKERRWRDITLRQVIKNAAEIDEKAAKGLKDLKGKTIEPVKCMKLPTVDKHFSNLVEYWVWLGTRGLIDKDLPNPFTGFIVSKPQGKRARKERDAWPQDMLTKLFNSPVWTGCSSMARRSKPGSHIFRDARFWVPLIGRGLGCREDEICSLNVEDIRFEDGIYFFHISDSKTEGSERDIPIPEWLLIMGFLEHRFYGRDKKEPLFPELLPQGVEGRRSTSFSSWFTEYRRAVECYKILVDFHSFRHNVSTDLQNMPGLNMGWADEITGHESEVRSSERSRYAKGVYMRHLKNTLDRIDIGVNLDHLAYDGEYGVAMPTAAADIVRFSERAVRDLAVKASRRNDKKQELA